MSMIDILKKLRNIENKTSLNESVITECPSDMGPQKSNVNISITGNSMSDIMQALANIEQSGSSKVGILGSPMDNPGIPGRDSISGDNDMHDGVLGGVAGAALGGMTAGPLGAVAGGYLGHKTQQAADKDENMEDWANEPGEEYQDHDYMTKDLSGGINRQKKMYKPAAKGDNPMAVESIKARLYRALSEKKSKPDFMDVDKDGDKKEPMKKALKDKDSGNKKTKGLSAKQKSLPAGLQKAIAAKKK